jgi:hypothetical protein
LIALIVGAASLANFVSSCGASLVVSSIFPMANAAIKPATSGSHAGNLFSKFHFISRFVNLIERSEWGFWQCCQAILVMLLAIVAPFCIILTAFFSKSNRS